MLAKLKQTTKHTVIYSLGNLSNKLVGFILLPLYTAYLTKADYGIFSIFEITLQLLIAVLGLNLHTSMLRISSIKKDENEIKQVIFTTFFTTFLIILPFTVLLINFSSNFSRLIFSTENYTLFFNIIFCSMIFGILNRIILNVIRLRSKAVFYAVLSSLKFLVILLSNIFFIVYIGYGVKGLLLSRLLAEIFLLLVALPFVFNNIKFKLNLSVLTEMISYGFPLVFSTVSAMILNFSDRYIIKPMLGNAAVGIYSMGYKVAGLINVLIIQSFQTGFLPIAYKMVDKPNARRFFSKVLTYLVLLLSMAALAISLYGREIFEIMSKEESWIEVYKIIPLFALFFVLRGINYNFSLTTHYVKKTKYNAYVVMSAALINIILNLLLIPILKIYGAAVASIISVLYMIVLYYNITQKLYFIPFELSKIFKAILLASLLFFSSYLFFDLNIRLRILLKLLLITSFPFILYYLNFYEKIELLRIKQSWQKWKNPKNWKKNISGIQFR